MTPWRLCLFALFLAIAGGVVLYSSHDTSLRPASEPVSARDGKELSQMSSKCATSTGICWVPAQLIGSPCQCGDGSYGTIIP